MRVVYTHDIFSRQYVGGISRYYVELIRHLAEGSAEVDVFAGAYANAHLSELNARASLVGQFRKSKSRLRLPRYVRNQFQQSYYARSAKADIVHHTYYSFKRPFPKARLIVTVHDLIPERFPKQFGWKGRLLSAAKRRTCAKADRILAISETTKTDLVEHFGIASETIDVVYLGNSLSKYVNVLDSSPHPTPYILYVGGRAGYKNCRILWQAFSQSRLLRRDFHLICFGGGTFTSHEISQLADLKLSELVCHAAGDDQTLSRYYRHASALVYPSLYEGFGLPPVEAMSFGCPIIASTGGAIPEIVGPAGVYFDPTQPDMLREVLETLLFDESLQNQLRGQMKERVSRFCWKQTAQQTLESYRKAA